MSCSAEMSTGLNLDQQGGEPLIVRDVMTTPVISVPYNVAVDVALDMLLKHGLSGLPMVDEHDRLVGLITEYDLLELYADDSHENEIQPCYRFMTTKLCTVQAAASLDTARGIFRAAKIRRLPVVDDDRLVGILSRRDILRVIRDHRLAAT